MLHFSIQRVNWGLKFRIIEVMKPMTDTIAYPTNWTLPLKIIAIDQQICQASWQRNSFAVLTIQT